VGVTPTVEPLSVVAGYLENFAAHYGFGFTERRRGRANRRRPCARAHRALAGGARLHLN